MVKKDIVIYGSRDKYPFHKGKHVVVKMEYFSYADESGIQASAPYCLLVGFVGSPRQWRTIESTWLNVLKRFGIKEFHAKEFFGRDQQGKRVGSYRRWGDIRANMFLNKLLSAAKQRRLLAVGGAVDVHAFNQLSHNERRLFTGGYLRKTGKWYSSGAPSKPYYLAMQLLIVQALQGIAPDAEVHFVFWNA